MSFETQNGSKFNLDLVQLEKHSGRRPGEPFVRVKRTQRFVKTGDGYFVAQPEKELPQNRFERSYRGLKRLLIGPPLHTREEGHQRLNKIRALAVFGSDPISSCAYATEASLFILIAAGTSALNVALWTALAVSLLLSMVAFSYRQTVHAYPHGGGSYNVASQNLGKNFGLVAAAALLIDYILTVAVSIVAGTQALLSALYTFGYGPQLAKITSDLPAFLSPTVIISLFFIALLVLGNLRGVREAGTIFAIPTYMFVVGVSAVIVIGLFKAATGTLHPAAPPPPLIATEPLTLWLVLRAFSAGAVAMSGTEAISNGVPVFKQPESKNAATTLTVMATLLGAFYLGISFLSTHMQLVPGKETIISQVALAVLGNNVFYYLFQLATVGILVVAGNTAFADFPRLSSVLARDNYMPHQFQYRGDRLAFSIGILVLGSVAALLVVVFEGNVERLINLYAIGVFLAFSSSDTGMVVHWWKTRGPGWKRSIAINGLDAVFTTGIMVVAILTKFSSGGWVVAVLIPCIMFVLMRVHRHYTEVGKELSVQAGQQLPPQKVQQLVLVLIDDVNYASLRAFSFARGISAERAVLHVASKADTVDKIRSKMSKYAPDLKLVVIQSPSHSFEHSLLSYVDAVQKQSPGVFVTLVLPEFITAHFWERFLHNRTAARLRRLFEMQPNVTLAMVPYLLGK